MRAALGSYIPTVVDEGPHPIWSHLIAFLVQGVPHGCSLQIWSLKARNCNWEWPEQNKGFAKNFASLVSSTLNYLHISGHALGSRMPQLVIADSTNDLDSLTRLRLSLIQSCLSRNAIAFSELSPQGPTLRCPTEKS
jgi:hypothetical protein